MEKEHNQETALEGSRLDTRVAIATVRHLLLMAFGLVEDNRVVNKRLFDEIDDNCANLIAQLRNYNYIRTER